MLFDNWETDSANGVQSGRARMRSESPRRLCVGWGPLVARMVAAAVLTLPIPIPAGDAKNAADPAPEAALTPTQPPSESATTPAGGEAGADETVLTGTAAGTAPAETMAGSEAAANAERTALNLLGEVDSSSGESRRNENVDITLIDNNVLKELNRRMGTTATLVRTFDVEKGYFGSEFGAAPSTPIHLQPTRASGVHGNFYELHGNSIFSARSFFQVGGVKPARSNDYGFQVGLPLWERRELLGGSEPTAQPRQRQRQYPGPDAGKSAPRWRPTPTSARS